MVAIRSSANPYRVCREKNSRVVNLWSHGVGLRQRLGGGETQERTASNGERESREQRTENRERGTRT